MGDILFEELVDAIVTFPTTDHTDEHLEGAIHASSFAMGAILRCSGEDEDDDALMAQFLCSDIQLAEDSVVMLHLPLGMEADKNSDTSPDESDNLENSNFSVGESTLSNAQLSASLQALATGSFRTSGMLSGKSQQLAPSVSTLAVEEDRWLAELASSLSRQSVNCFTHDTILPPSRFR